MRTSVKILSIIIIAFSLLMPMNAFADDACKIAGETDPLVCGTPGGGDEELELMDRVSNILSVIYLWIGIIAVIFIVIGGIKYMTSNGDAQKVSTAKSTITYSVIGLVVVLAAFAITNFVIGALDGRDPNAGEMKGDESGGTILTGEDRYKVRSIVSISQTKLMAGQTGKINARIVPDYAKNKKLDFTSSDPTILSVDSKGNIKAYKAGEVTVTIKSEEGPTKTVKVTVTKPIPVKSIKLSDTKVTLKKNKTKVVKATPIPSNATDKHLTWKSADTKIATVDQQGKIKAIKSGEETTVTVTARNKQVFAFNKSPNKITLADAEVTEELPKVQAKVKVIVESEFHACQPSTANQKYSGKRDFRPITKKIVNAHKTDFFDHNYQSKIKSYGGYTKYVKSLGGLFEMYAGNNTKVKVVTACDFQAAAEYTWGLWTIWGPDYDNGNKYHKWKGSDGFYVGSEGKRYPGVGYSSKSIDKTLELSQRVRTNCNYSVDNFIPKTTLKFIGGASISKQLAAGGGKKITNVKDLQVGDLMHFYSGGDWKHVATVGEIYKDAVILYEGGSRFMNNANYKHKITRHNGSSLDGGYGGYTWYATRPWKIDQSKTLEGLK